MAQEFNLNDQLKGVTPEAAENFYKSAFKGQINFLKSSPFGWILSIFFILIIAFIIINVVNMISARNRWNAMYGDVSNTQQQFLNKFNELNK